MHRLYVLLVLLWVCCPGRLRAQVLVEGIQYALHDSDATATVISGDSIPFALSEHIVIPSTILHEGRTFTITRIGLNAFSCNDDIISIVIPQGVTTIEEGAFQNCHNLTSVVLPESLHLIGDYAFHRCTSLQTVQLPKALTHIGNFAFLHCNSLRHITIPAEVVAIGEAAFGGCAQLMQMEMEGTVPPFMKKSTLTGCSSLTHIYVPNGYATVYNVRPWKAYTICEGDYREKEKKEIIRRPHRRTVAASPR